MLQAQGSRGALGVAPRHHDRSLELLDSITRKDCAFPGVEQGVILKKGDCVSGDLECGWRASGMHIAVRFGDLTWGRLVSIRPINQAGTDLSDVRTMPRSDRLTASYRSGVRFVGLMFPAPPWMMSRGLILGEDCGRLYSMFFLNLYVTTRGDFRGVLQQQVWFLELLYEKSLEDFWRTSGGILRHAGRDHGA